MCLYDLIVFADGVLTFWQTILQIYTPSKKIITKDLVDIVNGFSESLIKSEGTFIERADDSVAFTPRPIEEAKILAVINQKTVDSSGAYTILYGPKGAGKSTLVSRVLQGKKGVVVIKVSIGDTTQSILAKIVAECNLPKAAGVELDIFNDVLDKACKFLGHPVTVVFEVERVSSSHEVLSLVKHLSKQFAQSANVLIVISEANAVLGFGDDRRQEFIFVGEMTRAEGKAYAVAKYKLGAPNSPPFSEKVSNSQFDLFADQIGLLPLSIVCFTKALIAGVSPEVYIDREVKNAVESLAGFQHQQILNALKKSPNGVKMSQLLGRKNEGVTLSNPREVGIAMKNCPEGVILYDFETKEYRPFSTAHRTALQLCTWDS